MRKSLNSFVNPFRMNGWEAGIRTPIRRSRVCSPTVRRPPSDEPESSSSRTLPRLSTPIRYATSVRSPDRQWASWHAPNECSILHPACSGAAAVLFAALQSGLDSPTRQRAAPDSTLHRENPQAHSCWLAERGRHLAWAKSVLHHPASSRIDVADSEGKSIRLTGR